MGRRKKILITICRNENSIRERDVILLYDPSQGEENGRSLPSLPKGIHPSKCCPSNFTWCRLGCICESLNIKNLEMYNKHCRDTGFAACIFGCACGNLQEGQQLQTYKQLTFGVDKTKKLRWQDDDECGFVPPGTVLNLEDGRPKRKSQPPERFRHDVGGDRGDKTKSKKARTVKEPIEKKTGRPRRFSGDQRPLPIRKRNRFFRSCSSNVQNYAEGNENESDEAKSTHTKTNGYMSSPRTDLHNKKLYVVKKTSYLVTSTATSAAVKPSTSKETPSVIYGKPLSVVELEHNSLVISMVVRVIISGKNQIVSFVEWTRNLNYRPSVSFIGNFLRSKKIKHENDLSTIMRLPFDDSKTISWYFYDIPEDYAGGLFIMFPNLHAIISTALLQHKIETHKPKEEGEIHIINISDINSNKHDKKELEGSVYLLLEYDGAIIMGTSPPFYTKPIGEVIYVPSEGYASLENKHGTKGVLSNGNLSNANATSSETGSESERSNSMTVSDQSDPEESDFDVKIS